MTREELARQIYKISHLRGEFHLRSGQVSSEYFDKYRFESQPQLLHAIAQHMKDLIPPDVEALAALEMGGIPIGTALSLETGLPCLYVRKEAKRYGTCQFAEGLDCTNKKICLVEDVITTGGQVISSTSDLRQLNAQISDVICVIYRGSGKDGQEPRLTDIGLRQRSLFSMQELKDAS